MFYKKFTLIAVVLALLCGATATSGQTTGFTYQGRLTDGGTPANGNYDLQFTLWDSLTGGTQVGSTQAANNVSVVNGVFTVTLDFGAGSFPGANRFLEISTRVSGAGSFTLLAPRQPVTAMPYSIRSLSATSADSATTATTATTATNATQLGGVTASQYVQTSDSRLSDARPPVAGSSNYIQNTNSPQSGVNFNIGGNGTVGGTLSGNIVNAANQFNIGGSAAFSVPGASNFPNSNTFAGIGAGASNTPSLTTSEGHFNSFFGSNAGQSNSTGGQNSFFGRAAGQSNTTGSQNSFFGEATGVFNTTGSNNSFFGWNAGEFSKGDDNSFFGYSAGASNTGSRNSYFGKNAGTSTGTENTLIGFGATADSGLSNATAIGAHAVVSRSNSLVLGSINGAGGATADTNVGIGTSSPSKRLEVVTFTVGDGINLRGNSPAYYLTDGVIGQEKGSLGFASSAGLYSNDAAAGDIVLRSTSGRLILQHGSLGAGLIFNTSGTVSIPSLGSAGGTSLCRNSSNEISTCSSSLRYKTNVASFVGGLSIINRLRPIFFTWKQDGVKDIGLGAEEVEKVEPLLTFRNDKGEIEGVKYNQLSAVFINAFKEEQQQISKQQREIEQLRAEIRALRANATHRRNRRR